MKSKEAILKLIKELEEKKNDTVENNDKLFLGLQIATLHWVLIEE